MASLNQTISGTISSAFTTVWTLIPPFFLPVLGFLPTPSKISLNKLIVVLSKIFTCLLMMFFYSAVRQKTTILLEQLVVNIFKNQNISFLIRIRQSTSFRNMIKLKTCRFTRQTKHCYRYFSKWSAFWKWTKKHTNQMIFGLKSLGIAVRLAFFHFFFLSKNHQLMKSAVRKRIFVEKWLLLLIVFYVSQNKFTMFSRSH